MTRRTCRILAQIGMSFLVLSAALADDDPTAATRPAADAAPQVNVWAGGKGGGGGGFGGGAGISAATGLSGGGGGIVTKNGSFTFSGPNGATLAINGAGVNMAERPAIVTTQAMDAQTQTQFKEDLNIMDRLVRDSLAGFNGGAVPKAMGIRLMMLGNSAPMYVEGAGAVFAVSFNLPLAATTQPGADAGKKPVDSGSAWDRAKSELEQSQRPKSQRNFGELTILDGKSEPVKVDDVCDAVIKVLPEARNIAALKPDESVIVTIGGYDESGSPVRITLKAKKSDIDDASDGKIKLDEFTQRVAKRVG